MISSETWGEVAGLASRYGLYILEVLQLKLGFNDWLFSLAFLAHAALKKNNSCVRGHSYTKDKPQEDVETKITPK